MPRFPIKPDAEALAQLLKKFADGYARPRDMDDEETAWALMRAAMAIMLRARNAVEWEAMLADANSTFGLAARAVGLSTSQNGPLTHDEIEKEITAVVKRSLTGGTEPLAVASLLQQLCLGVVAAAFGVEKRTDFLRSAIAAEHAADEASKRQLS